MGVRVQRPGDPGHPGGNRRIYVRVNYRGHRKTRVFNSSKAAQDYAATVEAMLKLGKAEDMFAAPAPPPEPQPAVTFAEAAERWMAVDGAGFKANTRDTYQNIVHKHLLPAFGPRPLDAIAAADVEAWWTAVRSRGFSHTHLGHLRGVLAGIFKRAMALGLLDRNPTDAISGRLGREDREVRQAEWLTERELHRVLAVAEAREPRAYPLLLALASTGLRVGEALGLQVGDVDLERRKSTCGAPSASTGWEARRAASPGRWTCRPPRSPCSGAGWTWCGPRRRCGARSPCGCSRAPRARCPRRTGSCVRRCGGSCGWRASGAGSVSMTCGTPTPAWRSSGGSPC